LARLDRYILSQLTGPFAVFALILIGIYWVGRAVGLFNELISDGQSVGAFLKYMTLFLPQVVAIVLPVVSFAAALYVSNRLHADSEIVVFQSSGVSPFRLSRPFLMFGLLVAILAAVLSNYLVPVSMVKLDQTQQELSRDVAARLIVGGKFLHPSADVTFFVRTVNDDGSLSDIFLYDQRPKGRDLTYTAKKAVLLRKGNDARLVMFDGLIQTFDADNLLLSKVQFDSFVFDIGTLTGRPAVRRRLVQGFATLAMLRPTEAMLRSTGASAGAFILEAHKRLEQPLQSLVYPLIGMAVLMVGSFSRFGVFRQMLAAVFLVILLSTISVPIRSLIAIDSGFWPLIYLPDGLGLAIVLALLRWQVREHGRGALSPPPHRAGTGAGNGAEMGAGAGS